MQKQNAMSTHARIATQTTDMMMARSDISQSEELSVGLTGGGLSGFGTLLSEGIGKILATDTCLLSAGISHI